MSDQKHSATQLAQQGVESLQRGNAAKARELFQQALSIDDKNISVWLGLAFANARLEDDQATLGAVDKALALEPHNLRALLFKADHLARQKQSRKALVFYQAAIKVASKQSNFPADVATGLQRAQDSCQRYAGEYESYLLQSLVKQGYQAGKSAPRFQQALDIAFGKQEVYYQQPTRFYYPELPHRQFYPTEEFPWLTQVEAATSAIKAELAAVLQGENSFSPYLVSDPDAVQFNDAGNIDNADWGAFYFYQEGLMVEENARRCPETMKALALTPQPHVAGSTPHALYSKLAAHTKIPPHHGLINTRLICHLPLIVPENCGALRCGNQLQHWQEGEAYVFDDSIEHEAWNDSDMDRTVLLFDIWRPELSAEERELISAMLQAVQAYESSAD
jgi:aspartate beta-hydroxylase